MHQDLGQLQMYVNYFDRNEKLPHENNAVVKYSLPENNEQIFASKYELYLPSEQQLITEMKKEMERLQNNSFVQ